MRSPVNAALIMLSIRDKSIAFELNHSPGKHDFSGESLKEERLSPLNALTVEKKDIMLEDVLQKRPLNYSNNFKPFLQFLMIIMILNLYIQNRVMKVKTLY